MTRNKGVKRIFLTKKRKRSKPKKSKLRRKKGGSSSYIETKRNLRQRIDPSLAPSGVASAVFPSTPPPTSEIPPINPPPPAPQKRKFVYNNNPNNYDNGVQPKNLRTGPSPLNNSAVFPSTTTTPTTPTSDTSTLKQPLAPPSKRYINDLYNDNYTLYEGDRVQRKNLRTGASPLNNSAMYYDFKIWYHFVDSLNRMTNDFELTSPNVNNHYDVFLTKTQECKMLTFYCYHYILKEKLNELNWQSLAFTTDEIRMSVNFYLDNQEMSEEDKQKIIVEQYLVEGDQYNLVIQYATEINKILESIKNDKLKLVFIKFLLNPKQEYEEEFKNRKEYIEKTIENLENSYVMNDNSYVSDYLKNFMQHLMSRNNPNVSLNEYKIKEDNGFYYYHYEDMCKYICEEFYEERNEERNEDRNKDALNATLSEAKLQYGANLFMGLIISNTFDYLALAPIYDDISTLFYTKFRGKSHVGININAVKNYSKSNTKAPSYIPEIDKSYLMYLLHFDILSFIHIYIIMRTSASDFNYFQFFLDIFSGLGYELITYEDLLEIMESGYNTSYLIRPGEISYIKKDQYLHDILKKLSISNTAIYSVFLNSINIICDGNSCAPCAKVIAHNISKSVSGYTGGGLKTKSKNKFKRTKFKSKKKNKKTKLIGGAAAAIPAPPDELIWFDGVLKIVSDFGKAIGVGLENSFPSDIALDSAHDTLLNIPGLSKGFEGIISAKSENFKYFRDNARIIFYNDDNEIITSDALNSFPAPSAAKSNKEFLEHMISPDPQASVSYDAGVMKFLRSINKYPLDMPTIDELCPSVGDDPSLGIWGNSTKNLANHFDSATAGGGEGLLACYDRIIRIVPDSVGTEDNKRKFIFQKFWELCIGFLNNINVERNRGPKSHALINEKFYKICISILASFQFVPPKTRGKKGYIPYFTVGDICKTHQWNLSQATQAACILKAAEDYEIDPAGTGVASRSSKVGLPSFYDDIIDAVNKVQLTNDNEKFQIAAGIFRLMKYIGDKAFFIEAIFMFQLGKIWGSGGNSNLKKFIGSMDRLASVNTYNDLYKVLQSNDLSRKLGIIHVGNGDGKPTFLMKQTAFYQKAITENPNLSQYNMAAYVIDDAFNSSEMNKLQDIRFLLIKIIGENSLNYIFPQQTYRDLDTARKTRKWATKQNRIYRNLLKITQYLYLYAKFKQYYNVYSSELKKLVEHLQLFVFNKYPINQDAIARPGRGAPVLPFYFDNADNMVRSKQLVTRNPHEHFKNYASLFNNAIFICFNCR